MCFPAGLHYPNILPFGKVRIYGDIKTSILRKVRIKHIDFCDILDILAGKVNKECRPAGKHIILSGPSSAAAEIIVKIYTGTRTT